MEQPRGMSWSTFVGWYKNNKTEGVGVRDAWSKYKEEHGIKTKTVKKRGEDKSKVEKKKKTSTERRKKKGIRLIRNEDGEVIIDIIVKEKEIGDDRKIVIKSLNDIDWTNIRNILREGISEYKIGSISVVVDRPEIICITLVDVGENEDIKKTKKDIIKISKTGIDSMINDRIKLYFS